MAIFSSAGGGGGGGGSPGGSNTQFQFNNAGAFGGSTNFEFDSPNAAVRGLTGLTQGISLYNTADITTNTEYLRSFWSANVAHIITDTQGTGTQRELRLGTFSGGVAQNMIRVFGSAGTPFVRFTNANSANTSFVGWDFVNGALTASSGTQTLISLSATINQSGTAGFNGLLVNPTISTTGSGGNWLLQVQNSSSFRAGVAVNGQLRISSGTGQVDFSPSGNTFLLTTGAVSSGTISFQIGSGTMSTHASGSWAHTSIVGAVNQSGTAAYTGLLVNITETATGSGDKNLLNLQIGGVTRCRIDNLGNLYQSSIATGGRSDYNTADEVTNFERNQQYWNGSVFNIQNNQGGSGVVRELRIGNAGNYLRIFPASSGTQFNMQALSSATVATNGVFRSESTSTASSGSHVVSQILTTINQSATAGYTALDINVTETATGSGAKKLINTQVGGVTNFSILNSGRIQYIAGNTATTVGAAGGASALPATPTGYCLIDIGGTAFKIPYYAN